MVQTQLPTDLAMMVLAAGSSTRFGDANKLHAQLEPGTCVVERVFQLVTEFPFKHRVTVAAPHDTVIPQLAAHYRFHHVINENAHQGIGSSISCGMAALRAMRLNFSGIAFFLGDMPFITCETITAVASEFASGQKSMITRPTHRGQLGHPVLFPQRFAVELSQLSGDQGAGTVIRQHPDALCLVETKNPNEFRDIDMPKDLANKEC